MRSDWRLLQSLVDDDIQLRVDVLVLGSPRKLRWVDVLQVRVDNLEGTLASAYIHTFSDLDILLILTTRMLQDMTRSIFISISPPWMDLDVSCLRH